MARFRNGELPGELLIEIGSGRNEDGEWKHLLPRSTARKVARLIKIGEERRGRTLAITPGYNCYRPRLWQKLARQQACARGRCNDAAVEGTSSHGGEYQGRDSIAIDFANWLWVWGSREAFYAACREVGLTPGVFDWEPWHVCDFDDPFRDVPDEDEEEEDVSFTDQDRELLGNIAAHLYLGGSDAPNPNYLGGAGSVYHILKTPVLRPDADNVLRPVLQIQDAADTGTLVRELLGRPAAAVDVKALAPELVKVLGPLLAQAVTDLDADDLARIAKAVNDEQDRRDRVGREGS
ncbi:hypothetical protein FHS07_001906 [Microbacterium proteolyticum]|uniref:Uncharacterized protein n=1 Tax=Microbacterium proteolyticum TaxID=1572644 RepID=A0A7W5CIB8_9MICO|nr:hypothetical protein [Microbacterium proteolyticum]MBB3158210.1 hypothetical protein [Microbacterium proteolyticum]